MIGEMYPGEFWPQIERPQIENPFASQATPDQTAKADAGKPRITLVPRQIIWDIAAIREYGNQKYGSSDNWRRVSPERYRDALMRHLLRYLDDPNSLDDESGLPHLWHAACNIAFLCEMEANNHDAQ